MKKYILQFATAISLGVLLIANDGCRKLEDFGDTNLNPNGVPEPNTGALLSNVAVGLAGTVTTQPPAMFCQYLAESTYPGVSKYVGLQLDAAGTYAGVLQDAQVIIDKNLDPAFAAKAAANGDNGTQVGIASILKQYIVWTLTDRWGDLPYSEANKGAAVLLPKYDEQKDIYEGMIDAITDAMDMMNENSVVPVPGDKYMYGGDVAKWRKFGNSLKMLMALRLSKRYPNAGEFSATVFNEALNSPYGYITENADNFGVTYPGGVFPNPLVALHVSQDIAVSQTFTEALQGLSDARRNSMATPAVGCPYGLAGAAPIAIPYARILSDALALDASRLVMISAGSVLLAKAEAIERGWVAGLTTADAKAAYDAGITASFEQWGQTVPATYLTTGPANYTTGAGVASMGGPSVAGTNAVTTTKIQRINFQQWIAFYPAGVQGWSVWRRTGMPDLKPTVNFANTSGLIPRRYTYGVNDYSANLTQLNIAIARLPQGDVQDERVWWDKP